MIYPVKYGETITDVVLNTTGNIVNWPAILEANGFIDWVPVLLADQEIFIPDNLALLPNVIRELNTYPAANNATEDIYNKINVIFDIMNQDWILRTGFWNDNEHWHDNKNWID